MSMTEQASLVTPRLLGYRNEHKNLEDVVKNQLKQAVGLKIETIHQLGEIQPNTEISNKFWILDL
ncbi:MAG TPA: hypothetical protein IGS40_22025 [Trichormus sp. M33_DOE_039]|nr:hypothetical protein [Trichormus sp. M33_DOE_039]